MSRRLLALRAAAGAVLVLLLVGDLWLTGRLRDRQDEEDARRAALASASDRVTAMLSYDHRTLEEDLEAARAQTTGSFAKEFADVLEESVRPAAETKKIVTSADVRSAGVVRAEDDRVVVLLLINQTTRSAGADRDQVDGSRVQVTMVKVGQRWLVSRLDPV